VGAVRSDTTPPDLLLALDTEYVRRRAEEDHGLLPEAEKNRNQVLCYTVTACNPITGAQASGIYHLTGPLHRNRMYLGGLLGRVLAAAVDAGIITEPGRQLRIVLAMHFSRADICGFRDFHKLKRLADGVRGTYCTVREPLVVTAKLPSGRPIRCSIIIRDTMLLAPAGMGSLAALGEAVGVAKIKLGILQDGTPAIERMDRLREEAPELFEAYALRDPEVTLAWYRKVAEFMAAQLGVAIPPPTLGAAAVRLFLSQLEAADIDMHQLLGQEIVHEGRHRQVVWRAEYEDIRHLAERCYHGATNYAAVAGFMPRGRWTDVDLKGAYTTCLAAIRLPDWSRITEITDPKALADLDAGIAIARVRFTYPDDIEYPALPVRTVAEGLLFPLQGVSYCTGAEIRVALDQGATLVVERGVIVPWLPGSRHVFADFSRHIAKLRKQFGKGTVFELIAKEMGNSLYGKLAQGVYPDGPESRDGGITPGRAATGRRVFNTRLGTLERIPPSRITQALFAAYVTGLCRAVLAELVHRLPDDARLATATTDGFLVDLDPARIDVDGPVTRRFSWLRQLLDGDPGVLEVKHEASRILVLRTRGTVSVAPGAAGYASKPILARAGQKLEAPIDPDTMPGETAEERQLAAKWTEAAVWQRLYREREYTTRHHQRYMISPRRQWLRDADLVDDPRDVRVALDYDLKRCPLILSEREDVLCIECTRPWRDSAEFRAWRDDLDLWRRRHRRVLKRLDDWGDFLEWRRTRLTTQVVRRAARQMSPFVRALLSAWARGDAGLPRDGSEGTKRQGRWGHDRVAATLTQLAGTVVTKKMIRTAGSTPPVPPATTLTEADHRVLARLRELVPEVRVELLASPNALATFSGTRGSGGHTCPKPNSVEIRRNAESSDEDLPHVPELHGG
jgi:hypothetical protein